MPLVNWRAFTPPAAVARLSQEDKIYGYTDIHRPFASDQVKVVH